MRQLLLPFMMAPAFAAALSTATAAQQVERERRSPERSVIVTRGGPGGFSFSSSDEDRAWLGISTGSGGKRDTLGLLVHSVSPGSPAEKAGLEEGMRLQSINNVNLKLDAADAGEPELSGMMQRRLTRELGKAKPGDEVDLKVWSNGSVKSMRIKTGSPEDVFGYAFKSARNDMKNRAVLGVGLASSGSKRDTLGVFVSSVSDGGPADKAGIGEGDRIAAFDGTDLRVPKEDAGDEALSGARVSRLTRALRSKKPGDEVTLRVFQNGRMRDLKVTLGKPTDLGGSGMRFMFGDEMQGLMQGFTIPRISIPRIRIHGSGSVDDDDEFDVPAAPRAPMSPAWTLAPSPATPPAPPAAPRRVRVASRIVSI